MLKEAAVPHYPFELPALKFGYGDLEPYMDAATVELHHAKHHAAYVQKLNDALADHPSLHGLSVEDLLRNVERVPGSIRQAVEEQGGGHANHQFLWKILRPAPNAPPAGRLAEELVRCFGSFVDFQRRFAAEAVGLLGSGWVFLVVDPKDANRLKIASLPNNESVLTRGTPGLLICDVWEHAYYLKHRDRRADYLEAYWKLVDWEVVSRRLTGVLQGKSHL